MRIGRPRLIDDIDAIEAHRFVHQEDKSIEEAARRFNVSRHTLARGFKRLGLDKAA